MLNDLIFVLFQVEANEEARNELMRLMGVLGALDCFNLFNSSVVLRRVMVNGVNFDKPLSTGGIDAASANPIPAARVFRISARYRF